MFIDPIIPFKVSDILSHIFDPAISTLSTKLLHTPVRVLACFSILQENFSFNPVSIAFTAVAESIPWFHKSQSCFLVSHSCSSKTLKIGSHLSAICNTSSVDSFHFASICHKARITQFKSSCHLPTALIESHKTLIVARAFSHSNQNHISCWIDFVKPSLLNGVWDANSSISCSIWTAFSSVPSKVSKLIFACSTSAPSFDIHFIKFQIA